MSENKVKLVGYKTHAKAHEASRYATAHPRTETLRDGTFVGVGDVILRDDTCSLDRGLYGARGTFAWRSEAVKSGLTHDA